MLESTFDKLVARHLASACSATEADKRWREIRAENTADGKQFRGIVTTQDLSQDKKLGAMFATYRKVGFDLASGGTCSKDACEFANNGCYAQGGNVKHHSAKSAHCETDGAQVFFWALSRPVGAKIRSEVSGDCGRHVATPAGEIVVLDWTYLAGCLAAAIARPDIRWIRFTALWRMWPQWLVAKFAQAGVFVNASIQRRDGEADIALARQLGFQLATADDTVGVEKANVTIKGTRATICPEIRKRKLKQRLTNCAECMLCACDRSGMTVFPTH